MKAAFLYVPLYVFMCVWQLSKDTPVSPSAILPLHFLGMALNLAALIVTIRDLYLRPFANPNTKLTWLLLILYTGGIGWVVYVFKHALRPRTRLDVP